MLDIHNIERSLSVNYTLEIADTKVMLVTTKAKENGFPLKATMEEE